LREALARSGYDFLVAEPRRKKAAPRKGWLSALIGVARFLRGLANYPNRIAGALLVGLAAAITINALELQTSRHPAPLFGRTTILPPPQSPAEPVAAPAPQAAPRVEARPLPAPAPAATDPLGQFIRQDEAPAEAAAPAQKSDAPLPAARPDPISQILRETAATPAEPQKPSRTILAAQHALVKLGFVLEADGIEGEATRKAILQFDHDHHLPPRGELTPKLIHALRAESNIAIP
jgi:hypothetical protein